MERPKIGSRIDSQRLLPARLTFEHVAGREKRVDIMTAQKIGEGGYADIYRASVRDADHPAQPPLTYILKNFRIQGVDYASAHERANHSQEIWATLRSCGVSTWTTYRVQKDGDCIIMSDGEPDGTLLISRNASLSRDQLNQWPRLHEIDFDAALDKSVQDAIQMGKRSLSVQDDSWMARLTREGDKARINLIVGDFDEITDMSNTKEDRTSFNLERLEFALCGFVHDLSLPYDVEEQSIQKIRGTISPLIES